MFTLKGINQLEKAIQKAKKVRPAVKFRSFGNYSVKVQRQRRDRLLHRVVSQGRGRQSNCRVRM